MLHFFCDVSMRLAGQEINEDMAEAVLFLIEVDAPITENAFSNL